MQWVAIVWHTSKCFTAYQPNIKLYVLILTLGSDDRHCSTYYRIMSRVCSCSLSMTVSVFGFSAAVYVFVCLEASHTVYSLAPFLLPDRPIVSHWCTVGEIHTRGRLFLLHQERADSRHVENSIHAVFPKVEANLSDKKVRVRVGLWRPTAARYILIRLVLTVAKS